MKKQRLVNLGCGLHFHPDWINIDFVSTSPHVIAHNLLKGIPLESNFADVVYHSHVLEHFSKEDAGVFLKECHRVLKRGGIIRIAIPDLQQIILHYQRITKSLNVDPDNEALWNEYEWIMLELYDQTVRNISGGNMKTFLRSLTDKNKDFIIERCGDGVRSFPDSNIPHKPNGKLKQKSSIVRELYKLVTRGNRRERLIRLVLGEEYEQLRVGRFRFGGEIHQWMYDRYSLQRILKENGFSNYKIKTAFESDIENWASYNLDGQNGGVRKPDSLFAEAKKSNQ